MDLRIVMRKCPREVSSEECDAVLAFLHNKGFRLLLGSARQAYFQALGMTPPISSESRKSNVGSAFDAGDLIASEDWSEVLYLGQKTITERPIGAKPSLAAPRVKKSTLELGSICTAGESVMFEPLREAVCEALGIAASERWPSMVWANKAFSEFEAKGTYKKADFSLEEVSAATALCDETVRKLCRSVKAAGSVLVKDVPKLEGSRETADALLALGLLTEQHVVICRKTSGMVFQLLSSPENLRELDEKGIRCPACNRKPSDELLEQLLVPTDLCRGLLDHSRWMACVLVTALERFGVIPQSVLLEFQEGSDEIDAFVDLEGELVMVELKDKEFSMGQAYPLSARIGLFHPKQVFIVTADKVAAEVKEFFGRLKPETTLRYFEGLESLEPDLKGLVNGSRAKSASQLLDNFQRLAMNAEITALICTKMGIEVAARERRNYVTSYYGDIDAASLLMPPLGTTMGEE